MLILDARPENQADIESFNKFGFMTPDFKDPFYICKKVVIADGKVIGAGIVKLTTEGILILDANQALPLRAVATKRLIEECKVDLKKMNINECHVFVKDGGLQKLLLRLGFEFSQSGPAMILHF